MKVIPEMQYDRNPWHGKQSHNVDINSSTVNKSVSGNIGSIMIPVKSGDSDHYYQSLLYGTQHWGRRATSKLSTGSGMMGEVATQKSGDDIIRWMAPSHLASI